MDCQAYITDGIQELAKEYTRLQSFLNVRYEHEIFQNPVLGFKHHLYKSSHNLLSFKYNQWSMIRLCWHDISHHRL